MLRFIGLTVFLVACGGPDLADEAEGVPTWKGDVAPVIAERCGGCHQDGDIAPFPLTTYEEVTSVAGLVASAIEAGTMPPWQADNACNDYKNDISMPKKERDRVLAWIDGGTPEGKSGDVPEPEVFASIELDSTLYMAEPYLPALSADDYRCFVIEWPETEDAFVTGVEVLPDSRAQVHHVLVYKGEPADAQEFRDWDAAEDGPGYTCFGAATGAGGSARTQLLGGWVPGVRSSPFPEGTGIFVEPGSVVILQMHYNTSTTGAVPDDTAVSFKLDSTVENEAVSTLVTEALWTLGTTMKIPAGEASVWHEAYVDPAFILGVTGTGFDIGPDETIALHAAGLHMHKLGVSGSVSLAKADGSEQCLVHIPKWDFNWQGRLNLEEPVMVEPGDRIHIECEWDNSAPGAEDTYWGDGTSDEMCLSGMYLSRI